MAGAGLTDRTVRFFGHGGGVAWYLVAGMMLLTAASTWLFVDTRVAMRRESGMHGPGVHPSSKFADMVLCAIAVG